MTSDSFVGLFRQLGPDSWTVTVPDLPGFSLTADSFPAALSEAPAALREYLEEAPESPQARPLDRLMADAQLDWALARQFADAIARPIPAGSLDRTPAMVPAGAGFSTGRAARAA